MTGDEKWPWKPCWKHPKSFFFLLAGRIERAVAIPETKTPPHRNPTAQPRDRGHQRQRRLLSDNMYRGLPGAMYPCPTVRNNGRATATTTPIYPCIHPPDLAGGYTRSYITLIYLAARTSSSTLLPLASGAKWSRSLRAHSVSTVTSGGGNGRCKDSLGAG